RRAAVGPAGLRHGLPGPRDVVPPAVPRGRVVPLPAGVTRRHGRPRAGARPDLRPRGPVDRLGDAGGPVPEAGRLSDPCPAFGCSAGTDVRQAGRAAMPLAGPGSPAAAFTASYGIALPRRPSS